MFVDIFSTRLCNICLALQVENNPPTSKKAESSATGISLTHSTFGRCNGCQLVAYCGTEHQKIDWPMHRDLCRAVQKFMSTYEVKHPYLLGGQPKDAEEMECSIIQVKLVVRSVLGRPLLFHEEELTSFPRYCAVCYSFQRLQSCSRCQAVSYCSEAHALADQTKHNRQCGLLQLYYTPYRSQQLTASSFYFQRSVPDLHKTDLFDAFTRATLKKLPAQPTSSFEDYQLFATVADFSCIGTICYVLSYTEMQNYTNPKFVIFVLGAIFEQQLWFQDIHTRFFFLQYPKISLLRLFFIGPEVEGEDTKEAVYSFKGKERCVQYITYRGLFQDFNKTHNVRPSLIISYNCGFSEHMNDYKPAVKSIANLQPVVDGGDVGPPKSTEATSSKNIPPVTNVNFESNNVQKAETSSTKVLQTGDCSSIGVQQTSQRVAKNTWALGILEMLLTFHVPIAFTSYTFHEALFDYATVLRISETKRQSIRFSRIFNVKKNPFRDLRPVRHWRLCHDDGIFYRNGYVQGIHSRFDSN